MTRQSPHVAFHVPVLFAVVAALVFIASFLTEPQPVSSQSSPTVIFLTSGSIWTVPVDWNPSNNSIEVIGGGGGGHTPNSNSNGQSGGGGGGAYSRSASVAFAPGIIVAYVVGAGGGVAGNGGDTYLCSGTSNCASIAGSAVVAGAKGGTGASSSSEGFGGQAAGGVGSVKYSGGNGGDTVSSSIGRATGGGGAAGPNGNGGTGGAMISCNPGSCLGANGGGAANGGSNGGGHTSRTDRGEPGGNNRLGTGGGAGGNMSNSNGGNGTSGGGGGGGQGGYGYNSSFPNSGTGGNGGQEVIWTQTSNSATAGPGGGGGGGGIGINPRTSKQAGSGAIYGGGGGGGSAPGNGIGPAGTGASGIIVITYTPFVATVPDAPASLSAIAGTSNIALTWSAPATDGGSAITGYKIYRDTSAGASTLLTTIGNLTNYTDSTATAGTTYYYRVKATNAVGDSAYSNEDSATVAAPCTSGGNMSGWAWSDTIGWISLNSENESSCPGGNYGLTIDTDGNFSGYAWSENVGWISANAGELTGCPTSPCTARMSGNNMQGWWKALAANDSQSGGWDGFISLSGTSPDYGPALASGTFTGYAWGDMNLGWISFSSAFHSAQTTYAPCTPNYVCTDETHRDDLCTVPIENEACTTGLICSTGACVIPPAPTPSGSGNQLKVSPQLVRPGGTSVVTWDVSYATSCTVTEDNSSITDSWTGSTGSHTSSAIRQQTTYTLNCTGAGGTLTQRATVYQTPSWKEL